MSPRFPIVFGDNNNWGQIWNDLLAVCLAPDGTLNADIVGTLALAPGAVTNTEVNATAAIARSKLNFGAGLVNGDIAAAAAIGRSKLDFGSGLVDADVAAAAALAISKLAGYPSDAAKFLAGDGTWKAPVAASRYGTLINVVSSTTETDVLQAAGYTVAANTLSALSKVRVSLSGDFLQASGVANNMTLRIYWGGTVIWANTLSYGNIAGRQPWNLQFTISNRNSTSSQYMNGHMEFLQTAAVPTTGIGDALFTATTARFGGPFAITTDPAKATTSNQTIRVTFQWGTSNASSSFQCYESTIEFL